MLVHAILFWGAIAVWWWCAARALRVLRTPVGSAFDASSSPPDRLDRAAEVLPLALGAFTVVQAPWLLGHASSKVAWVASAVLTGVLLVLALRRVRPSWSTRASTTIRSLGTGSGRSWHWCGMAIAASIVALGFVRDLGDRRVWAVAGVATAILAAVLELRGRARIAISAEITDVGSVTTTQRFHSTTRWLLLAVVGIALVLGFAFTREDVDDVLYLSQALELQNTDAMGLHQPDHHGEELPANPLYALQAFELFGAQWCTLTGVPVTVGFRTLLAPLLWIASLLMYRRLFRAWLPEWLVPSALIVSVAYFVWGPSSHWTASNYFFPRPQQGKTWMLHLYLPALWVFFAEHRGRRGWRGALTAVLLGAGAAGTGPTAVFLVPSWCAVLAIAELIRVRARVGVAFVVEALAAIVPCLLLGLWILAHDDPELRQVAVVWSVDGSWFDALFFHSLGGSYGGGALELAVLMFGPLLLVGVGRRSAFGPAWITLIALLSLLNPLLFQPISDHVTGRTGYSRMFWLLPFGPMLAYVVAVGVERAVLHRATAVASDSGVRSDRSVRRNADGRFGLVLLGVALLAMPVLGGRPWCAASNTFPSGKSVPREPYRTRNLSRTPAGLEPLVVDLSARAKATPGTLNVLCTENVAAQLAPRSLALSFVYTREYQTPYALTAAGRANEVEDRRRLAEEFLLGHMPADEAASLLAQYHVDCVVSESSPNLLRDTLIAAGYALQPYSGGFECWIRN